jgi:hypothetical protein
LATIFRHVIFRAAPAPPSFFVILSGAQDLALQAEMALTFLCKNAFLVAQASHLCFRSLSWLIHKYLCFPNSI